MMGLYAVAVFLLFAGISQAQECDPGESCSSERSAITGPPKTPEEFDHFCEHVIPFTECALEAAEKCNPESEIFKMIQKMYPVFMRMCNEDSLLNKAIKENIACLTSHEEIVQCSMIASIHDEGMLKDYSDALAENGITLTPEELESRCPTDLYVASCMAATGGNLCGDVAKAVIIELLQSLDTLNACKEETIEKLNVAVDVMETQIAEGNSIQSVFAKKDTLK